MTNKDTIKEEFSDEYVPSSNWFKFEEVGNSIKGTLVDRYDKESKDETMPDQVIFVLRKCEVNGEKMNPEEEWNVGIKKSNTYILSRMKNVKLGQRVGFLFEKEIEPSRKGMHPAKSIKPFAWGMDEDYESMVAESSESENEVNVEDVPFN